jgi:hypothetical protein
VAGDWGLGRGVPCAYVRRRSWEMKRGGRVNSCLGASSIPGDFYYYAVILVEEVAGSQLNFYFSFEVLGIFFGKILCLRRTHMSYV